jgi:hypothetical protein
MLTESPKTRSMLYVLGMVVCLVLAVATVIFGIVTKEQLFMVIALTGELFIGFLTVLAKTNVTQT